jgi:hypothetical protein
MKLGPVHLIRDVTFRRLHALQDLWHQFSSQLTAARGTNALADRVLDQTHGLMHSPLCARMPAAAPPGPATDDPADTPIVERLIAAYHRARADAVENPTPSMWDRITGEKADFLSALGRQDVPAVRRALSKMFLTDLTWGLGQVHASHPDLLRQHETHLHFRFMDTLVSLAEAVGAVGTTSMLQDPPAHLQPLNKDPDRLYAAARQRLGFDPGFPNVGGAYGFRLDHSLASIDSLTHAYTAHRLTQLGAGRTSTVFELGGGYGCLALMARRAGVGQIAVFDLPWVNVLQGYFLLRTLPAGTVRLYGETVGDVRVAPYWALSTEPVGACDFFVNTDSLPEMGRSTAAGYLPHIHRVTRKLFLSINQEARAEVPGVGPQNCVRELVEEAGGWACRCRQRHWMRQGYVEEVFEPARPA